jgi:peptidoglycan/xylan/chitin deacetylase (PgdA/CDA1 family)
VVALTFDDGPWDESTDAILDVLEENGAKATFFTIGNQIADHTSQIQREKELGCQVCTHSWDHASGSGQGVNLTYMSDEEQTEEIQKGYEAIREVLGEEPSHVIRAPGGNYYGSIVNTLKTYVDAEIGWDVDTEDWRLPGSEAIYERIMSATDGQIVLMHDGGGDRSQTVEAVRRAVPELISQGYRLVTIDELLEYETPAGARSM